MAQGDKAGKGKQANRGKNFNSRNDVYYAPKKRNWLKIFIKWATR